MQHRRGQLASHALAERELSHRHLEELIEVEHLAKAREVLPVAIVGHLVDVTEELERVGERQVPPELHSLAEHHADAARQLDALPRRLEACDGDPT